MTTERQLFKDRKAMIVGVDEALEAESSQIRCLEPQLYGTEIQERIDENNVDPTMQRLPVREPKMSTATITTRLGTH
ncbi:hypothetical protein CR513_25847, partial [Mucuna pruriens]